MKPFIYATLSLIVWTSNIFVAHAIEAGPYQTVFLFIAYHLDAYAYGVRDEMMAAGCKGSMNHDLCNLWEFISYVQADGYKPDSDTLPGTDNELSDTEWPDPVKAASYMRKIKVKGSRYHAHYDVDKVFLKGSLPNKYYSSMLDAASGKVAAAAQKLGPRDSALGVERAQQAITGFQQARMVDWVPKLLTAFEAFNKKVGLKLNIAKVTLKAIDGSDVPYVDIDKMINEFSEFPAHWLNFLLNFEDSGGNFNKVKREEDGHDLQRRDDGDIMSAYFAVAKFQMVASKVFASGRRQNC